VNPIPNTHPAQSPGGAGPEAELRELQRLALDVAANRGELVSRVDRFLTAQEARLRKEGSGPSRRFVVRANDLVPSRCADWAWRPCTGATTPRLRGS
jgi:hypothetical protein